MFATKAVAAEQLHISENLALHVTTGTRQASSVGACEWVKIAAFQSCCVLPFQKYLSVEDETDQWTANQMVDLDAVLFCGGQHGLDWP